MRHRVHTQKCDEIDITQVENEIRLYVYNHETGKATSVILNSKEALEIGKALRVYGEVLELD